MAMQADLKAEVELLKAQLELAQMMLEREARERIALEKNLATLEAHVVSDPRMVRD